MPHLFNGRQKALIFIDDVLIETYPWCFADSDPHKHWLEDEFVIPSEYITGKSQITVKIVPQAYDTNAPDSITWNDRL